MRMHATAVQPLLRKFSLMTEPVLFGVVLLGLAWPLGHYLAAVMRAAPMRGDAVFAWLEKPIYAMLGVRSNAQMGWRSYALAFVCSNVVLGACVWLILMGQAWLPLNPDQVPNMRWDLALHTMVSFLTNTNQQHYAGQAQLSYLAQMTAVVGLQVVTPAMGLAVAVATLRALLGVRSAPAGTVSNPPQAQAAALNSPVATAQGRTVLVGNYWVDVCRAVLRFFLPLCVVLSLLLGWQGVPATLSAGPVATALAPTAQFSVQKIPLGPVAPLVAIKQLGSNGGGWYGPNSAAPLENPTPLSNFLQLLAIALVPVSIIFMIAPLTGRKRLGALVLGTMLALSVVSASVSVWSESVSPSSADVALMEGKEVRIGADNSALWSAMTTQINNGSVNMMLDSAAPLTGLSAMLNVLINAIWGGIGSGLQQFWVYLMLSVFLAGLMTGRSPEFLGRKIEAPEVRLLSILVLLQPLVILGFTAVTLAVPGLASVANPSYHAISQVFYEYASAFANNGSGFEGLQDSSVWWNVSCTVVLILGRYPALLIPLAIAAMLACKRQSPESAGTLQIETPTFGLTVVAVILILTLLQFLPVLVLGPVADHLTLTSLLAR